MLEAGEESFYIARRMIRFASKVVGNADPQALAGGSTSDGGLSLCRAAGRESRSRPGCCLPSHRPEFKCSCTAFQNAQRDMREIENMPVPLHIRNAPTTLMNDLGYGKDYKYPRDYADLFVEEEYLPENLKGKIYYQPSDRDLREIKKLLEHCRKKKGEKAPPRSLSPFEEEGKEI
jgi:putative ATPase